MNSTHNDDGWVTDREALRTIIELRELRVGDEVLIDPENPGWSRERQRLARHRIPTLIISEPEKAKDNPGYICRVRGVDSGYIVSCLTKRFIAWRRPCPSK